MFHGRSVLIVRCLSPSPQSCTGDVALDAFLILRTFAAHAILNGAQNNCHAFAESTSSVQKLGVNNGSIIASASIRGSTVRRDYRTMDSGLGSSSYILPYIVAVVFISLTRTFASPIFQPSEVPQSWDARRQLHRRCYIRRSSRACLAMASYCSGWPGSPPER